MKTATFTVCNFARLFAKLPRPGNSEVTLVPSSRTQQANLPAYLHTVPFNAKRQAGKL